jgi:hypothetical protein
MLEARTNTNPIFMSQLWRQNTTTW